MEKKEKKADLEQLLNTLIEKGWKPFGERGAFVEIHRYPNWEITTLDYWITWTENPSFFKWNSSIRDLVSKESGLWQFCCENKLITNSIKMREAREHDIDDYSNILIMYDPYEYQFRLIESSLKDESELESFLLENIKVE